MSESANSERDQSSSYRVEVISLAGRLFKKRPYSHLFKLHQEVFASADFADFKSVMNAISRYAHAPPPPADTAGSLEQARSVWTLLQAINARDDRLALDSVSSWLSQSLQEHVAALITSPVHAGCLTPLDLTCLHLTARDVEAACDAAWGEDPALALLVAQAGQHTSLAGDMRRLVDWLEEQARHTSADTLPHRGPGGGKALQVYRLLAGDVDAVLDVMRDAAARDPGGSEWLPGRQLLDWRRSFGLYLWYTHPSNDRVPMPPEGMPRKKQNLRSLMFHTPALSSTEVERRLSLQGAFLLYMHQQRRGAGIESARASHPFPAYLESPPAPGAAPASSQLHAIRAVWPAQAQPRWVSRI